MELHLEVLPSSTTTEDNILRRSSSAPLISGLGDNSQLLQSDSITTRRNSATCMTQHSLKNNEVQKPSSANCTDLIPASAAASLTEVTGKTIIYVLQKSPTFRRSQSAASTIRSSVLGPLKGKGEMTSEHHPERIFQDTTNMLSSDTNPSV